MSNKVQSEGVSLYHVIEVWYEGCRLLSIRHGSDKPYQPYGFSAEWTIDEASAAATAILEDIAKRIHCSNADKDF